MPNTTNITPPRVPLVDPDTGYITREWYRFLFNLFTLTGGGKSGITLDDLAKAPLSDENALATILTDIKDLQSAPNPEVADKIVEIQKELDALKLQVYPQLGTMAALQQANLPWVTFDTTPQSVPTGAAAAGTLYWNTDDNAKTLNLIMEDTGGVVQQIGEETYYRVKADSPITNGQVVMFTGTLGASGGLKAAPATGLTAVQSEYIMGVATQNIATNGWGYVTWFGKVKGINTTGSLYGETWADGDILYYNPAIAGGLTKNVPTAPNPKVIVASVVHAATNGILFVRPTFGSALGATDSNVQITSLTNGDILQYNSANSRWENIAATSVASGTATNLAGGAANRIPYQTGASTTSFIVAPTVANTYLNWSGSAFQWSANPLGTVTSVDVSGGTTGLTFSGGPVTTSGTITMAGTLDVDNGGTGQTTYTNGQLLIGNTTGNTLTKATLTAGTGVTITNGAGSITIANTMGGGAPVTKTADFTVAAGETWLINNKSGSTCIVTLPTASANTGRMLVFQNYQNQLLNSSASNVVNLGGGAAGTAILSAVAGTWATLVSDGTNWVMMQEAPNNALLLE